MRFQFARLSRADFLESIELGHIVPSKFPLRADTGDLTALMASISEQGLIEPLIVRPGDNGFEIVCGHRRYEAFKRLSLKEIPCVVQHFSDQRAFEASLVENVQRQNLDPVEEARAFKRYVTEFGWGGVSRLAKKIGKSEEYVSHRLLLLTLPEETLAKVSANLISASNARELVWLKDPHMQKELSRIIADQRLSVKKVRRTVKLVRKGAEIQAALSIVSSQEEQASSLWTTKSQAEKQSDQNLVLLERTIGVLRVAMMRVDELLEDVESDQLKEFLIDKRFNLHQMIDECIRAKRELS